MKKSKLSIKLISIMLAVLVLLVSLPMYAFASSFEEEQTTEGPTTEKSELVVLEEDESLREENIKHFKLSDGTSKAVIYPSAVHYLDENGKWIDINNALTLNGSEYASSNKFEIKFANKSGSNGLVSIKDGEYKIVFTPLDAEKSSVLITNPQESNSRKFDDVKTLEHLISKARYENVYNGIDLEYILIGNSIKENIIVKELKSAYTFSFELKLNKLEAQLQDGAVILLDSTTKNAVYKLPEPYMYDASGRYSDAVEYTLTKQNNGKYILTVTADPVWISTASLPVTIDPTVTVNNDVLIDTYTTSASTSNHLSDYLYVGNSTSYPNAKAYIKPTAIPQMGYYNMIITDARLTLYASAFSSTSAMKIGAYQITSDWEQISPECTLATTPIDYQTINVANYHYTWNITELVRAWDEGEAQMHGICLQPLEAVSDSYVRFGSADATATYLNPVIEYSYVNAGGIQSHMSYYTSSAGSAGTGYINSFNGELIFAHSIFTTADEIMPYTLSFYLDGKTASLGISYNEYVYPFTNNGINYYCWERADGSVIWFSPILSRNPDGTYEFYEYLDDGTRTAVDSVSKYYDESGLGLCLEIDENGNQVISDENGNKRIFNMNLTQIVDSCGNIRYFTHENGTTVISLKPNGVENAISQLAIGSGENGVLIQNLQTGVTAELLNVNNYITGVVYTYPSLESTDTTLNQYTVSFEYGENYFIAKDNESQKGLKYTFTNGKVSSVQELAYTDTETLSGQMASISYDYMSTTYRTSGADNVNGNGDDVLTVYNFDYAGRVITAYSCDGSNKNVYGATNYAYNDKFTSEDVGSKRHNSIKSALKSGANAVNLLKNPSFELNTNNWTGVGGSIGIYSPSTENLEISYGMALNIPRSSAGTTKVQQTLGLEAGEYNASASIAKLNMKEGSTFYIRLYDSNGALVATSQGATKHPVTDTLLNRSWERESLNFTLTSAGIYTLSLEYITTSSTYSAVYVDDVMLENHAGMGAFSAYEDGTFEQSIDTSNAFNASLSGTTGLLGSQSMRLSATASTDSYYKYTYDVYSGIEAEKLLISAWVKAPDAVSSTNAYGHSAKLAIRAVAHYSDTSDTAEFFIPISPNGNWQYVTHALTINPDGESIATSVSGGRITSIDVYLCYDKNIGYAYFDEISINRESNYVKYEYNSFGNLVSTSSTNGTSTSLEYSSGNATDVTGVIDTEGNKYQMSYDSNHHLVSAVYGGAGEAFSSQLTSEYTYNDQGQITSVKGSTAEQFMLNCISYNADTTKSYYSKVLTASDELGFLTRYFYYDNGLLKGIIDPNNNGILYEYNSYGELIGAKPATYNSQTNSLEELNLYSADNYYDVYYEYNEKHELSGITTNSTEYTFTYDEWGNLALVDAGGNTLTAYEYGEGNGNLVKLYYGNGAYVEYVYDNLDRVVGICYNGIARSAYIYSSNGQVSSITDLVNDTEYQYYYDGEGKLINERVIDGENNTKYNTFYKYDETGKITQRYMYFPDSDKVNLNLISYTYNEDGSISSIQSNNGTESYIYDDFGRITSNSLTAGTSTFMTDSYSYFTPSNETSGLTSNRISAVTSALSNGESYSTYYTYDNAGNITCIRYYYPSTSTSKYVYYQYDAIGQLEREDNQLLGYTYLYGYDDSGNMVYKETRSYTTLPTESISSTQPLSCENFGRTDDGLLWHDRRKSYYFSDFVEPKSGTTTYDEIGNPLTYFNGSNYTFTWQNGRELASATKGSTVVTYEYNQDGIRIAKEANGLRYEYDLSGTQIVREREYYLDTNRLVADRRYFYDANGIISSAKVYFYGYTTAFTETEYTFYFRTNIQGDVLAVYNAEGTVVMEVTYDAWGNFTDTVSNMSYPPSTEQLQALAMPFRYRGYYYDQDTGLYYLNTRYYDAKMHRFINADSYVSTGQGLLGANMYAYCGNNPVMYSDPSGHKWYDAIINLFFDTIYESTEAHVAAGVGFSKQINDFVKVDVSKDLGITLDNGEYEAAKFITAQASILAEGTDFTSVGLEVETHEGHYGADNFFELTYMEATCEECRVNDISIFGFKFKENGDVVFNISASYHVLIGGRAEIGVNLSEVRKKFLEDWNS